MSLQTSNPNTKPRKLTVEFDRSAGCLRLQYRRRDWGVGFFMILWLIGWTVGCIWLAWEAINQPQLFHFLFAIPFWASWIFAFLLVLKRFLERERFELDADGVRFSRRAVVSLASRNVPLEEIQAFDAYSVVTDSESNTSERGIEMQTLGKPVRFGQGLSEPEIAWFKDELNEHLAMARNTDPRQLSTGVNEEIATHESNLEGDGDADDRSGERLVMGSSVIAPPSDTRWRRLSDFSDVIITERGRFEWSTVGTLMFVNAFWNGILSVFIVGLIGGPNIPGPPPGGWMWWGEFVFLIPFEVIGLVMLFALIVGLLEPIRRTTYRFGYQEVTSRTEWMGIGYTWRQAISGVQRIDLSRVLDVGQTNAKPFGQIRQPSRSGTTSYQISLIDRSNCETYSIGGLTEGEARWIGDVLLRERPDWFR
jgi:hypothetical protein